MIDLMEPLNLGRSEAELQDFLMLAWLVAGKTAYVQNQKFYVFRQNLEMFNKAKHQGIFDLIKDLSIDLVMESARMAKLGKYTMFEKFLIAYYAANLNLKTCSLEELEQLPGIGFKTSRFFMLYNRPGTQCAVLDTWILKFLAQFSPNVPKTTPTNRQKYLELEQRFLNYCREYNLNAQEFDLSLWKASARKPRNDKQ